MGAAARMLMRWGCIGLVTALCAGCGADGVIQRADRLPPPPPGQGFIEIRCAPGDADVFVDDRYAGRLDGYRGGVIRLPEGRRRIALRKTGHYSWYGVFDLGPAGVQVRTRLVPVVP